MSVLFPVVDQKLHSHVVNLCGITEWMDGWMIQQERKAQLHG